MWSGRGWCLPAFFLSLIFEHNRSGTTNASKNFLPLQVEG